MLADVIGAFKGFFSRAFWFGNFLPIVIFGATHLAIAWWVGVPGADVADWVKLDTGKLAYFPVAFAALIVLAYALTPLVPVVRGTLDGTLLPQGLYDALFGEHLIAARAIRARVGKAFRNFTELSDLEHDQNDLIAQARQTGNDRGGINNVQAIKNAANTVATLEQRFDRGDVPGASELKGAADLLVAALESNAADAPDPNAALLDDAHGRLAKMLGDAEAVALNRYKVLLFRNSRIAFDNPQATRMADTRMLVEDYCYKTYGVTFDFLWPRLQIVLPQLGAQGDVGGFNDKLVGARAQIDFAILSLGLSLTLPLVWLPYLAWTHNDPAKFLVIGAAAPLIAAFFYRVVVESQFAFGEVMKAAVDSFRFDVLGKLRQPLPITLSAEKELWGRVEPVEGIRRELFYKHPKSPP